MDTVHESANGDRRETFISSLHNFQDSKNFYVIVFMFLSELKVK